MRYNLTDARLVSEILAKLRLLDLAVERSRLTGLPVDRVAGSIAAFDFLYLSELGRRGIVAPSVGSYVEGETDGIDYGGYVLEPVTGLHHNVLVFDFKSLYPEPHPERSRSILSATSREPGPMTETTSIRRAQRSGLPPGAAGHPARASWTSCSPGARPPGPRDDPVASQAIKILMNSFYGVLGTPRLPVL